MFARLKARRKSTAILRRALPTSYRPESLERRLMLTTFNSIGQQGTFDYYTSQGTVDEIAFNDVDFEAVGCHVNQTTGVATLGNLVQAQFPTEPPEGANLYYIYVTESNADSFISIYDLTGFGTTNTPNPYGGSIPSLGVNNAQTGAPYATAIPANTGSVFIGDVNPVSVPANQPLTGLPLTGGLGLVPDPGAAGLNPGIDVIPINAATNTPNNFGSFLIGGTLTGTASFGGNLNEFYAGAVLTGDITGDPAIPNGAPTSSRTDPNNFFVAGDLRDFITNGPVGTDGLESTPNDPSTLQYITSFDLNVGGKIGEIHVGNFTAGSTGTLAGTVEAGNNPLISGQSAYNTSSTSNLTGIWTPQLEASSAPPGNDQVFTQGEIDLSNATINDAQVLGSVPILNPTSGLPEKDASGNIEYEANLDGNGAAIYAVAFEGGTTFQVTLSATTLQVINPQGQVIASNSKSGTGPQQLTATLPGLYYFSVTGGTDYVLTITNVGNMAIGGIITSGFATQSITNGGYSDIGVNDGIVAGNGDIGAIQLGGTYSSTTLGPTPAPADPLTSQNTSVPVTASTSILVANGNLRSFIADTIGQRSAGDPTVLDDGPTLSIPNGNLGVIESTNASTGVVSTSNGVLNFNSQFDPNYLTLSTPKFVTDDLYASAIGGSIQSIIAATTFQGDVATNAGIGSILASDMGTDTPSFIDVNADNKGQDGIIDLIEVLGNFGTLQAGGPGFVTHDGGDIRYMLLLGTVFRDEFFGGGVDGLVTYPVGQTVHFTDQAGNAITIAPIGPVTTTTTTVTTTPANSSTGTAGVPTTTTTTTETGPQISLGTYQIRDKGGEVPIQITSTGSMSITAAGTGPNSVVNIASLVIEGTGSNISNGALDAFGNTTISQIPGAFTAATNDGTTTTTTTNADGATTKTTTTISGGGTTTNLSLQLFGSTKINVLNAFATTAGETALSNPTLIENETTGELASFQAENVGQILVKGNLGITTPVATPAALEPLDIFQGDPEGSAGGYPFAGVNTGIDIPGDAVNIDAGGGVGNVEVDGTLQSLIANYSVSTEVKGAKAIPGQFDGIVGPIEGGFLLNIDVGQGVLPTGTGAVAFSGIFGVDTIGVIDNNGNRNSDIRGNVVSEDDANFNTSAGDIYEQGFAIGQIFLTNGSLIDQQVDTVYNWNGSALFDNFAATDDLASNGLNVAAYVDPDPQEPPFQNPYSYELGSITVTGNGGIIGLDVNCTNIGPITVTGGGFGILDSIIDSQDLGRVGNITASGYGIRDTTVTQCGYLGEVTATGNGSLISVLNYPIDVRESDIPGSVDPYFGFTPNDATDINAVLGTSLQTPNIPGVTDTGVIQDDVLQGQELFSGLSAAKVRTATPLYTNAENGTVEPTPTVPNVPAIGVDFPMEISFAEGVGQIHITQQVDGLQITTATLAGFYSGTSVNRLGISTSGELNALLVRGNLGNFIKDEATDEIIPDSYINAGGASGILGIIKVLGNLTANISATGVIQNVLVTGDLLGSLTAEGQSNGLTLGTLHVYGGIRDNSLVLDGSVGSIIVNGTLGTSAGVLSIYGGANLISVGANNKQKGSTLGLALKVLGTLGTLRVHGTITGPVTTGGDLTNLVVVGDGTAANVIQNTVTVGGRIGTATISNGNVAADISANGYINSFTIKRGSLLYGSSIQSVLDAIHNFTTTGGAAYGMYGSLLASNGANVNLNISGSIGDGTDPAVVSVYTGTRFLVHGNIADHSTLTAQGQLNLLQVIGNIDTGAIISAHPLVTQKITGTNDGSITII